MEPRDIPEIQEAANLLKLAEKEFPSEKSADDFEAAFEILNNFLEHQNPSEKTSRYINNTKLAYTKNAVSKINSIQPEGSDQFISYLQLFGTTMKSEFKLSLENPELKREWKKCCERFGPPLLELLKRG